MSTSHIAYVHAKGNKSQLDFLTNDQEISAAVEFQGEIKVYMLLKTAFANKRPDTIFISLQDYFSCIRASHTEKSNVFYLKIMDAKADSKDSIMSMLYDYLLPVHREKRPPISFS